MCTVLLPPGCCMPHTETLTGHFGHPYSACPFAISVFVLDPRLCQVLGARGDVVVKALRYKPAGRGFDSSLTLAFVLKGGEVVQCS